MQRLTAVLARPRLRAGQAAARRVRGQSPLWRRRRHGQGDLPPHGPDFAAHDRAARRHDAAGGAHRHDAAWSMRRGRCGCAMRARCCACGGSQIRPERQVGQVGAELIGSRRGRGRSRGGRGRGRGARRARRRRALGRSDLADPGAGAVPRARPRRRAQIAAVRGPLDHKDAAADRGDRRHGQRHARPAAAGRRRGAAGARGARRRSTCRRRRRPSARGSRPWWPGSRRACPDLAVTVDPVENRGFEYHTGISFAFFARGLARRTGARRALSHRRGGRARHRLHPLYRHDAACGARAEPALRRLFVPAGTAPEAAQRCRGEGWITVAGLEPVADDAAEARRLGCGHRLAGDKIVPVG